MKKTLSTGFIDPISLISLGIVIVGLVITTFIVKNPEIKLVCFDPCQTNADCNTNEYCYRPASGCSVCKPKASPPATSIPSPSPSPASTCSGTCVPGISCADEGLCNASGSCSGNKHCCKACPSASPSPSPTPTPPSCGHLWEPCCGSGSCNSGLYCSNLDGGTCMTKVCTSGQKQCSGNSLGYCKADGSGWNYSLCPYGCVNNACQAAPSPSPSTTSCSSFGACFPGNYICERSYGQLNCGSGNKCGVHCSAPSPSPSPSPTPTTSIKCSSFGNCYRNIYVCETNYGQLDCSNGYKCGVHCSIPSPSPSRSPSPNIITQADCDQCLQNNTPSECAGVCKNIGGTITTPLGQTECTAGEKFCSGGNLKICSNSGTWGLTTCSNGCENGACKSQSPDAGLIATYNILNTVTFGAFGNYVQTYQDINAQNPQASYLQQALNPQGIAASAQLGVVLTAEAAAVAAAGPAAQAIAGLPVAALMAQNALATTSWLQTAAAVTTLSQLPASIIACQTQGANSAACQYAAMGITAGYFTDPIGTLQGLQTSAQQVQNVAQTGLTNLQTGVDNFWNIKPIYADEQTRRLAEVYNMTWGKFQILDPNDVADLTPLQIQIIKDQQTMGITNLYYTDKPPAYYSPGYGKIVSPGAVANFPSPDNMTIFPYVLNDAPDEYLTTTLLHEEGHIVAARQGLFSLNTPVAQAQNEIFANQYAQTVLTAQYGISPDSQMISSLNPTIATGQQYLNLSLQQETRKILINSTKNPFLQFLYAINAIK